MKISKSLLKTIAAAVAISTVAATQTSCTKDFLEDEIQELKAKQNNEVQKPGFDCPACGMG